MKKILCAEDEPQVRSFLVALLKMWGFEVVDAQDTDEAIALLRSDETFDMVLTDEVMPGEGGVAVARISRELSPTRPIVVCSGTVDQNSLLAKCADAIVTKPFLPKELYATLERVILTHSSPIMNTLWTVHQECLDLLNTSKETESAKLFREEFRPRFETVCTAIAEEREIKLQEVFSQPLRSPLGKSSASALGELKYWVSHKRGRPA